jgi:uncharacterized membrane protein YcaP (DUF421 family)
VPRERWGPVRRDLLDKPFEREPAFWNRRQAPVVPSHQWEDNVSLSDLFGTGEHLTWWQESTRAVLVFIYGLTLVRVTGRRAFGKWSALDIIVSIIIGSCLSRTITGNAPLGGTLLAMAVLMALHWVLAHSTARYPSVSRLVEGSSIELARSGVERTDARIANAISAKDLSEALRKAGVEGVADTRLVMLEPSGNITVIKRQA